jgi:hypothetical protein
MRESKSYSNMPPGHRSSYLATMPPLFIALISLMLASCEKDITIDLRQKESSLVVDASIENGQPPFVILSSSLGYYDRIDPKVLASSFVRKAEVYVSDGVRKVRLKEDSTRIGTGFWLVHYSIDPTDPVNALLGRLGTSYTLDIRTGGKVYRAVTTIPAITRRIDSLWWERIRRPQDAADSNRAILMLKGTDKPGLGSYIRYFTQVNSEPFLPGTNSVFDDQVVDGTTYTVEVDRGVSRNEAFDPDNDYFQRGDTVVFKLCEIDKATYDFWRTLEFSFQSVGNPFSNPIKVLGNVSGGALGSFSGYAAQYRSLIIPKR